MAEQRYTEQLRVLGTHPGWQVTPTADHQAHVKRQENDEHETLDQPGERSPQGHSIQYHGGEVLSVAKLVLIWAGEKDLDKAQFAAFAADLMTAGYFDAAKPYLNGSFSGTFLGAVEGPPVTKTPFTQSDAIGYVQNAVASGLVPKPDRHTIYSIMLPPGIQAQLGSDVSCPNPVFCAYHTGAGDFLIDVEPDPTCAGCTGANTQFQAACMLLSHEVCETVEDPFGQGWWETATGMEPSDIVAWIPLQYGPWTVQGYFGNEGGGSNLIGSYHPIQQPPPQPPPTDPLSVVIAGPSALQVGAAGTFIATSQGSAAPQYRFDFGDGVSTGFNTPASATHTYAAPTTYPVRAYVLDPATGHVAVSAPIMVTVTAAPVPKPPPTTTTLTKLVGGFSDGTTKVLYP